jgi:hypothetical protein
VALLEIGHQAGGDASPPPAFFDRNRSQLPAAVAVLFHLSAADHPAFGVDRHDKVPPVQGHGVDLDSEDQRPDLRRIPT